jgi:coenzyme F420-dependent glucose-6-phosphate dehydrogenase
MGKFRIGVDVTFWTEPDYSLACMVNSEEAGFDSIWIADHFLPWHHSFKQSFYAFSMMAAAAERTKKVPIGVDVTVPIGARYHPAIVAHAFGTLGKLYPGRILLGVGSGESMSEERFLGRWPPWQERIERLTEAIEFMRKLWTNEDFFDFKGKYFKMDKVLLYVKPSEAIPVYFSAFGKKSAHYAGVYGDHLMTCTTAEKCRDLIFPSFEEGARSVGRDPKKMEKAVQIVGGIGDVDAITRRLRRTIAGATIPAMFNEPDPRKIEEEATRISDEMIRNLYSVCSKPDEMIDAISKFKQVGADHVLYTDLGPDSGKVIEIFKRQILPYFRESS